MTAGDDTRNSRKLFKRSFPTFIHIPKNGGSTVEKIILFNYEERVGRLAFEIAGRIWNKKPLTESEDRKIPSDLIEVGIYETNPLITGCSVWHTPPATFVRVRFFDLRPSY